MMTAPQKPLTPIEKLIFDKNEIQEKCRVQEEKLKEDFAYIRNNVSSLLFSGMSTLLFPSKNTNDKESITVSDGSNDGIAEKKTFLFSDLFSMAKSFLPIAWEIAQPILFTWGIHKTKSLLQGMFTRKKKNKSSKELEKIPQS